MEKKEVADGTTGSEGWRYDQSWHAVGARARERQCIDRRDAGVAGNIGYAYLSPGDSPGAACRWCGCHGKYDCINQQSPGCAPGRYGSREWAAQCDINGMSDSDDWLDGSKETSKMNNKNPYVLYVQYVLFVPSGKK
jgi:hypothetical protein